MKQKVMPQPKFAFLSSDNEAEVHLGGCAVAQRRRSGSSRGRATGSRRRAGSFDSRAISGEMTTVPCVDGGVAEGAYAVAVASVDYGTERLLTASDFGGHMPALLDSGSSCLNLPQDAYARSAFAFAASCAGRCTG